MKTFPAAFEERMKKQLSGEAEAFLEALCTEAPVSIRLNPGKPADPKYLFPDTQIKEQVAWCENGRYLDRRPLFTLDPCLHGGAYYVQEASSMFLHHILKQVMPSGPIRVLDLCAAPGGKSTLIASLLTRDSLMVSNEVIRSRASILKENIIKWGQDNVVVTNNDPADFHGLKGAFDIVLVDAPCSGEGMFRKDEDAIQEWSENNTRICSERQKRILADIWDCLRPGGMLIYSTCTYNPGENEEILDWLVREYNAESIEITHDFDSITAGNSVSHCYHFYPHKTLGEGFFTGVVRKGDGNEFSMRKGKKQTKSMPLPEVLKPFIRYPERYSAYTIENLTGIIPTQQADFISYLEQYLRVIYKGCEVAEINNRKIKLLPPLALWQGLDRTACTVFEADRNTALTFLKKEDFPSPPLEGDWILITFQGIGLGWCKNLGNRLNNYYPKEWRIRMEIKAKG